MHISDADLFSTLSTQTDAEPLRAAVYARVHTNASFTHWLGPLGNYLVARPAARHAAHETTDQTGVPLDAAVVLGLGAQQLHIWSADPMRSDVADYLGSVDLERIAGVTTEPASTWAPLEVKLADGQSIELEARGNVWGFASSFNAPQS
jgi:hypothetical protein